MAVITPQTDVYLLKVPLEIDEINQLTFANAEAQYNYFYSAFKLEVDNFTYQRKDGTIRFSANFDEVIQYNYVMYRNEAYSNKWFYAFITSVEYVNDNLTNITIKTDPWQTWQFDITLKSCLVDREHVNDDTPGKHTLPEELELGEMITNGEVRNFGGVGGTGQSNYRVVAEVSQVENEGESATMTYAWSSGSHDTTPKLNNIDRGTTPLVLPRGQSSSQVTSLYDFAGLGDSIVNIYMIPEELIGTTNQLTITVTRGSTTKTVTFEVPYAKDGTYDIGTSTFTRPSTLDNYVPKNKKLLTYPYCYFNISNNAGASVPFRYEDFTDTVSFKVEGTFGVSGSTKAIPQNYLRIDSSENALDYSINGPKYPVCSWKSDSYTNWLTQNAVNLSTEFNMAVRGAATNILGSTVRGGIAGSFAGGMGAVPGALVGAGAGIFGSSIDLINMARSQHLAKTQANMVPDQVKGNLSAGDFVWAKYRSPFTYLPMCIKREYAECLDEYLSQFGYKCNRVKVPNITGRRTWNYVKTVGCYIQGNIPQDDMQEIKNMFDHGVTFWHDPLQFGNYGANNDII